MKIVRFPLLLSSGWLMMMILPSLLMVFKLAQSFTTGIFLSSTIYISLFLVYSSLRKQCQYSEYSAKNIFLLIFVLLFIFLHFYIINLVEFDFNYIDMGRYILSYIILIFMLCSAFLIATYLKKVSDVKFNQSCMVISIILFFNGLISLSKIDFFGSGLAKPSFIYLEPSHFSLAVAPFVSYYCLTATRMKGLMLLIFVTVWAIYIQNLTMVLAVLIAYLLSTRNNLLLSLSALLLIGVGLTFFVDAEQFSYFSDRLSFSGSNSDNLSVLVLYLGWDNAIKTLTNFWFGGGFQQFGITTLTGDVSDKLYQLLGFDINQFDGGSTAPKIIGEFGLFGVVLVVIYLIALILCFRKIRIRCVNSKKELFASIVIVTSFLELFVRGVGYFSPSLFMFVISVFYLLDKVRQENIQRGNCIL